MDIRSGSHSSRVMTSFMTESLRLYLPLLVYLNLNLSILSFLILSSLFSSVFLSVQRFPGGFYAYLCHSLTTSNRSDPALIDTHKLQQNLCVCNFSNNSLVALFTQIYSFHVCQTNFVSLLYTFKARRDVLSDI